MLIAPSAIPQVMPLTGLQAALVPRKAEPMFFLTGVTRDASGAPLGGCAVDLFPTVVDVLYQSTVSDANGNYTFAVPEPVTQYYARAYLPGSPDVAGTTLNTLVGS